MRTVSPLMLVLAVLAGCTTSNAGITAVRKAQAETFVRGVYGCDPTVVDTLAGDDVLISYPIFAELFGTDAFRGREAVRGFAEGFCRRWEDARFTVHESVAEDNNVVLIWSFRARYAGPEAPGGPSPGEERAWGGISLFQFDDSGKIIAEIGEESTPGPMARVAGSATD